MQNYLDNLTPKLKAYFNVLSEDFPDFLLEYIQTPAMQKQDKISISCGTFYTKLSAVDFWYSSLEHSIAVALIIWHFTKDKKQTLSGLFHDISTPVFKHCIDFMNNDHETQESTEDLTKTLIASSPEIMALLKRDGIDIDEVADYHIYPIADNDTPMLSADRLEYTLSNGLGAVKKVWNLQNVKEIYDNIQIITKENGEPEMAFTNAKIAEKFVKHMSTLSCYYMGAERRFSMQFLADIMKLMFENNLISVNDLYSLSEAEVINMIENCDLYNISDCFKYWRNATEIKTSPAPMPNAYNIKVKAKKRYINPLVKTPNGQFRISELSATAKADIEKCKTYSFDEYLYLDFSLNSNEKAENSSSNLQK